MIGQYKARPVFGEGALTCTKYFVASLKLLYILADRLDLPRHIDATNTNLGHAEPEAHNAEHIGQARHDVPVTDMNASRMNTYPHVIISDYWLVNVSEFQYVR